MKKEFSHTPGYAEDIVYNKKIDKIAESFQKHSIDVREVEEDEPDFMEGKDWDKALPNDELTYGKKNPLDQHDPIMLYETKAGMEDLMKEFKKGN